VGAVTTYTFTNVLANHTIAASFAINTYTITASVGANGSISPSGAVTVNATDSKTFTIAANTNYHVADVLVDGVSVGAVTSYTFTNVLANHTIAASFAIDTYTITASAGANGSISPSGAVSVNATDSKTFTIAANTNYHVADVLVDGSSVGAVTTYTFTNVLANHTIAASFAINTYTIAASASSFGNISPSGNTTVTHGANQSFIMTPNAGYIVLDVLVDGSSVGAVTSHTFTNVTANHTIAAKFGYNFTGFFQPVDNYDPNPNILNRVKAGQAVPVKFSLHGYQTIAIFDSGYPGSAVIPCASNAELSDVTETLTAGGSSLSYDATTDQYNYVWKTEKSWAGACRQLVVKLNDGSYHRANFNFTK